MKNPTKKEFIDALKDFDVACELIHKKTYIVQPLLALYMKHGKVVSWLDKQKKKEQHGQTELGIT
jgi:uncharacterized membrane protein